LSLRFTATTDAPDSARQLAGALGEIATLALYAAQQNAALRDLVRSVTTTQQEQHVLVAATIPYALVDSLASVSVAAPRPPS
ncbi:MAG: hypothetical protein JW895_05870, partial [Thermoleophilaceae bacterium]|nr:hypothetical protein [Thermoleophilaceae bacterium]